MNRHPRYEILQDYFENTLDIFLENSVRDHLYGCDQCTNFLSDFLVIESRIRNEKVRDIPDHVRNRIFKDAGIMIEMKNRLRQNSLSSEVNRQLQIQRLRSYFKLWKLYLYPEIRTPALQLCSLSLVLATFIMVEKKESREVLTYEPLSTSVNVYTNEEFDSKDAK